MENLSSIRDLINQWPTREALAADIRSCFPHLSVTTHQVHKWAEKDCVPARYHFPILVAGRKREFPITAELIARLHLPGRNAA